MLRGRRGPRVEVLDDELDALDRTRFAERQTLAEHHRARRPWRCHLYDPHVIVGADIVIEPEPDTFGVEGLRRIDVGHGDGNDLKLHFDLDLLR